jgi:hypothetical protein
MTEPLIIKKIVHVFDNGDNSEMVEVNIGRDKNNKSSHLFINGKWISRRQIFHIHYLDHVFHIRSGEFLCESIEFNEKDDSIIYIKNNIYKLIKI